MVGITVEGGMVGITITVGPIVIVVCNEIVVEIAVVPAPSVVGSIDVDVVWPAAAPCWALAVSGFFLLAPTPPPTATTMTTTRATKTIITIPFLVR